MKNILINWKITTLGLLLLLPVVVFCQAPSDYLAFSAIVRGKDGVLAYNQDVGIKITLQRDFESSSTDLYTEVHSTTTNEIGMVRLKIGSIGAGLGSIDWGLPGDYFMKWEIDPNGGSNYTIEGKSSILTVPYAFHSNTADTALRSPINLTTNLDSTKILGYLNNQYVWVNNSFPTYTAGDSAKALFYGSGSSLEWKSYDTIPSGGEGSKKLLQYSTANKLEWIASDTIPAGGGADSILVYEMGAWDWAKYIFPPTSIAGQDSSSALAMTTSGIKTWKKLWSYPDTNSTNKNFALSIKGSKDSLSWEPIKQFEYNGIQVGQNDSLGGFVFYVTSDGKHGLVANYSVSAKNWFEAQDDGLDPTNFDLAQSYCKNFLDWRLPTEKELTLLMTRSGFSSNHTGKIYWSSSESFVTARAYHIKMSSPEWLDVLKTDNFYDDSSMIDINVIAVRSF